jgi:hypothetical protein
MHDQLPFTSFSTPGNDLDANISDMVGGREHLSFWHGVAWHGMAWHGMASTMWNS